MTPGFPLPSKRFLFLFSDTGGGHRAAAQAVKDELTRLYGAAVSTEMVDIFVEMRRWPFDRFPAWYPLMTKGQGIPWYVGYHLLDTPWMVKALSRAVWPYVARSLCRLLQRHPSDVIVSFHGVPNYALMLARRQGALSTPVAVVALDLVSVHACWFAPGAEVYIVPTERARTRALRAGMPAERVKVIGMPIRRSFVEARHRSPEQARAALGLPVDQPLVLLVGGGEGMGPLIPVTRAIAERRPNARLVVIVGRNRSLYNTLRALDLPLPLQVEGFTSDMAVWMRAADVLVTKAGPNTLAEAFIAGLPLVLYAALPGQEEGNIVYVVENHAGVWAPRPQAAADAVMDLLAHPEQRAAMAARSQALARPYAAQDIAQQLWALS
ncbi:MAG TPA: glycosyltransferase [Anaerolineae bacterium]|nr:glycosyltransferase [Anaerolineae bacterium]HQH38755.1 glycosyltransferase [Anaerolineae bacterium]